MSRTRLILLGLLAVVVVGVVASASATEPPKACGGKVEKVPNYCVGGFQLENSKGEPISEKVEGTNGESILKATIASVTSEVKCGKGKTTGTIEDGASGTVGKSKATIKFEECKLIKPANCRLTAADEKEIETTPLKGELTLNAGRVEDKLESKTAAFAGISIEGKEPTEPTCVIADFENPKTFNITGSQLCEVGETNTEAEAEVPGLSHKTICKTSGSSLKLGGNKAEIASEATTKLVSGKKWSVKEHT
jgi:hypothetical protein